MGLGLEFPAHRLRFDSGTVLADRLAYSYLLPVVRPR
jgi:hypothetical protein